MKILLVSLFNDEAIGLRQFYSILRNRGYDTRMMFFKLDSKKEYEKRQRDVFANRINQATDKELDIFCDFIANVNPDVIGISLVSSNFHLYKKLYSHIRNLGNHKVVLGGWQPTLNPEECIPYCDVMCIGDGDEAFPELIDRLYKNEPIENIRNLWVKTDGQVIKNPVRSLNRNLDSLPNIVFDNSSTYYIENNEIVNEDPYMYNTRYGIIAGRGCPYHCTYCSNSYMIKQVYPSEWSKIRYRSVDHVMNELLEVKAKLPNVTRINFYDKVFLPPKLWGVDFFKRYKEEIGLPFYCMFYPGTLREDMLEILKEGLLAGVWLGVQSGSERVRKEVFKRYYTNSLVIQQARLLRKHNVDVRYDFIFDNPFESFEESLESIKLMLELPEPFSLNLFSLKYFPNTELTKMALDAGITTIEELDDHLVYDQHNYMISQKSDDSESNFINHLAMYISLLAKKSQVRMNKERIYQIIYDYKFNKNIRKIKGLLEPFLREQ